MLACAILTDVRWHISMASIFALGAVGLTVGAIWAAGIPMYRCAIGVANPSGWIYAGLLSYAIGLVVAVLIGVSFLDLPRTFQRLYVALGVVEAAAAIALFFFIASHYWHYGGCP